MRKSIILLVLLIFLVPSVYAHHMLFHFGSGKAVGEKCEKHVDCSTFLCFNMDPNGLDMQCVACGKKIPVKGGGTDFGWETGWQGKPTPPMVEPACGPDYSVCNKNKEPYKCEKPKDACGGCTILSKCNEKTKKCESIFPPPNKCPTGNIVTNPSDPTKIIVGSKVNLDGTASDPDKQTVSCNWKVNGNYAGKTCKLDYIFNTPTKHTITLTVSDGKCEKSFTKEITPVQTQTCKSKEYIIFTMTGNKDANVGTWDSSMNIQVCHKGDTSLKRNCTGNNKVLKYLTGKAYAPNYEAPGLKDICYGDYSCYVSSNAPCKETFTCLASYKDAKNSVVGTCDMYANKLCCKQGCPMVEMKCPKFIKDQDKKLKPNTLCKSDGKKAAGTCQPGCAFNGQFYGEGSSVKIGEVDSVCDDGAWCPFGFFYDPQFDACEPTTESCFVPKNCPIDTPTEEKKDTKWFINNKCVVPDQTKACCFVKFGTTKYYGYNILPDKDEISFY